MHTSTLMITLAMCVAVAAPATKVVVNGGVKECDQSDQVSVGDAVSVHFTGTIDQSSKTGERGANFDHTDRNEPFNFTVGEEDVISGWVNGLTGLCKGAKATLIVPPEEAYGDDGADLVPGHPISVPGGATLNLEVEVLDATSADKRTFRELDTDGDKKISKAEFAAAADEYSDIPADDETFGEEDRNSDGFISWTEFEEGILSLLTRRDGAEAQDADKFNEDVFKEVDLDGDGKLTKEELIKADWPEEVLMEDDKDDDGAISFEEFEQAETTSKSDSEEHHQKLFDEIDADGDGKINEGEMMEHFTLAGEKMPEGAFEKDDHDNDGFVSREEFLDGPKEFLVPNVDHEPTEDEQLPVEEMAEEL